MSTWRSEAAMRSIIRRGRPAPPAAIREATMTDIVERLRALVSPTAHEAADEIERLQEELHYCNGTCDLAMKHRDAAEAELAQLKAEWKQERERA